MVARDADNTAKGNGARRKHLSFVLPDISSSIVGSGHFRLVGGYRLKFF